MVPTQLYLLGGSLWLLNVLALEVFAGVPQLETATPITLLLLGAGLVNVLSSIPMANTRSWVLNGLCVSVMQLWNAWYVSGAYPASFHAADPWLAAFGLSILVISYAEAEEGIVRDRKARELVRKAGRRWSRGGRVVMHAGDHEEGDAIHRFGAIANIAFNGPHLYATLVGSGWVERLSDAYPMAPVLLFHAYFALAAGSSLALLAPTLYSRRLITARGMSIMQGLTAAPMMMGMVDASVMGSAVTNNPLELYLGFLH